MKRRDIAVVVGSLRHASFNRQLAGAVAKLAPSEFSFKHMRIDDLPLCNHTTTPTRPRLSTHEEWHRGRPGCPARRRRIQPAIPGVLKNAMAIAHEHAQVWLDSPG